MGMFDTVFMNCPMCKERLEVQSKGGECILAEYELQDAPPDVIGEIYRSRPLIHCDCGAVIKIKVISMAKAVLTKEDPDIDVEE